MSHTVQIDVTFVNAENSYQSIFYWQYIVVQTVINNKFLRIS